MTEVTQLSGGNVAEADRTLVLERVFAAPRALVFKAYTDPAHLPKWFGPRGFTCTTHTIDIRPGGSWHFIMHGPNGVDYENFMRYQEIVQNERLVYDHGESPDGPAHFHVTVTFTTEGAGTRVRMQSVFPTVEACEAVKGFGAVELGYQTLDKLAEHLAGTGLNITRTFDAPRELVYKAWSESARLAKWWGPKDFELEVLKLEFKPGGVFHYRMHGAQGEMYGKFVYLEMESPERLVWITSFSDPEGNTVRAPFSADFPIETYNVLTLTEVDGKTVLNLAGGPLNANETEQAFYNTMFASMQQGFKGTFDKLDDYLAQAV